MSQSWRDIVWRHRVRIISPEEIASPYVMLLVTGSGDGHEELDISIELSRLTRMVVAILHDVPNQPLFGDLYEDALMAHTFAMSLESGEQDWPLLFPMVKSVVRAMDAIEDLSKNLTGSTASGFTITGASKRGWTTWLTATVDERVKAIAPMVYDNLNIPAQMKHQVECYGAYSEQISDYTRSGLLKKLDSDMGRELVNTIDPYSYIDKLELPKLIINGTNDRFWTVDSLNLYFNELLGEKHILYVPNSGHGLEDRRRVTNTLAAFASNVSAGLPLPSTTTVCSSDSGIDMEIEGKPQHVDAWSATSASMDFRDSRWSSTPLERTGERWFFRFSRRQGFGAFFFESSFRAKGFSFTLSSPMHVSRP